MLSNVIQLNNNDATPVTYDYDLVSRQGMESRRRETTTGVPSREGSTLRISNVVDLSSTAKNRHLVQLSWIDDDADGIAAYPASVHVVISRNKNVSDDKIKDKLEQLAFFLLQSSWIDDVLIGGN